MEKPRIVIQRSWNLGQRLFHVSAEICMCPIVDVLKSFSRDMSVPKEVGTQGRILLEKIFEIPGVQEVFIEPYTLSVILNPAFDWAETEPEVIEILKSAFSDGDQGDLSLSCLLEIFGRPPRRERKFSRNPC